MLKILQGYANQQMNKDEWCFYQPFIRHAPIILHEEDCCLAMFAPKKSSGERTL